MRKSVILAASVAILLSGCRESEKLSPETCPDMQTLSFSATCGGDDDVKSILGGTNHRSVLFSANDAVSLFSTKNTSGAKLTTTQGTVGTQATFSGTGIRDDSYHVIYPYTSGASFASGTISGLTVPTTQTAVNGSYDPNSTITYASTTGTTLHFSNLCALLKIKISKDALSAPVADSIVVTVNSDARMTGTVSVNTASPALSVSGACAPRVKLAGEIIKDSTYYISIIPGTYSTVTVTAYQNRYGAAHVIASKHKSTSSTFGKGKIYDLGTLTVTKGVAPVDPGTGGRSSCSWVQLWKDGPKWAEFNLGSTAADYINATYTPGEAPNTAYFGDYYTWGAKAARTKEYDTKNTILSVADTTDVARILWKYSWKMPSKDELDALMNSANCTWEWCDGSSVQYAPGCTIKGYKVSGKGTEYSQSHIFLPAAGRWKNDGSFGDVNTICNIWSASAQGLASEKAYALSGSGTPAPNQLIDKKRELGYSIRPVFIQ